MAKYRIKDVERLMIAYIYEVEADSEEEALDKYINELAGSLDLVYEYVVDDANESITIE